MIPALAIIGRERALIDALAKKLNDAARGHEVTKVYETPRGAMFDVRIFDGKESSGRIARVSVDLERVEQDGYGETR